LTPLNATAVVPDNSVPPIVTDVPTAPLVGEKPATEGAALAAIGRMSESAISRTAINSRDPMVRMGLIFNLLADTDSTACRASTNARNTI
jgi:hypothetical protein